MEEAKEPPPPMPPTIEARDLIEEIAPFLLREVDGIDDSKANRGDIRYISEHNASDNGGDRNDSVGKYDNGSNRIDGGVSDNNDSGDRSDAGSTGNDDVGDWQTMEATAYTAYCDGCSGITKTGVDVRQSIYHDGKRVIAVSPKQIPLGSTVEISIEGGTPFKATAQDVGGDIGPNRVDILMETKEEAKNFGRRDVAIRVVD